MADCEWHFGLDDVTRLFCYARETILFFLIIPLANAQPLSFDYPNFRQVDVYLEGNASFSDSVIQLTAKVDQNIDWAGSVGRVIYPKRMQLWNKSSNELKDFTTKFSFVVFSNQIRYADGLTFFLASPNLPNVKDTPELKGAGLGIGLVDPNQTLLPTRHQFVAVEFDTFSNNWDPDGIHVGVNINSMRSEIQSRLFLAYRLQQDHTLRNIPFCHGHLVQVSETISDLNMDDEFLMGTGPKKISYYELVTATNNFEETRKLGQGGFGGVYKGYLKDSNSYAAIKRISADSRQGIKEYTAEVKIISQLRHRNLVKLTGWCHKKNDLLLIYEYMPNGSLDSHLFGGESILSWQVRYNIALGLASALLYLQEEWEKCVLHRDIKSSNIMLDSNFNAKLGDFGLARMVDHEKGSQTTVTAGTTGYLAPEYMNTGKARKESDIFSFGVVLLELASGRKAIHPEDKEGQVSLVEWVWELYGLRNLLAAADPKLCGVFDMQQMKCLLVVGLWCANPDCRSMPSIRQVIKVLNFEAPLPILPQQIPVLTCIPPTTNELFFSVSSSFEATS